MEALARILIRTVRGVFFTGARAEEISGIFGVKRDIISIWPGQMSTVNWWGDSYGYEEMFIERNSNFLSRLTENIKDVQGNKKSGGS